MLYRTDYVWVTVCVYVPKEMPSWLKTFCTIIKCWRIIRCNNLAAAEATFKVKLGNLGGVTLPDLEGVPWCKSMPYNNSTVPAKSVTSYAFHKCVGSWSWLERTSTRPVMEDKNWKLDSKNSATSGLLSMGSRMEWKYSDNLSTIPMATM